MSDASEKFAAANARFVVLTRRGVGLSLLAAAVALVSLAIAINERHFRWNVALVGMIVAQSGFQVWNAHRGLVRLAPAQARTWMPPLAVALYVVGGALIVLGAIVGVRQVTSA